MAFESISTDATHEQLSAWAMRMMQAGYSDAGRMERAFRVVKDCANIKDPLKIADRFILAYHDFAAIAANSMNHHDPIYRYAVAVTFEKYAAILSERFPMCMKAYGTSRREKLAVTKGGKRQLNVAERTITELAKYGDTPNWASMPPNCRAVFAKEYQYWLDQSSLLCRYA